MVEVTKHNFDDEFPLIIQRIKSSAFVAIDTEFTALTIDEELEKSSLFDTGELRYRKHYRSTTQGIANQIGLSIFHFDDTTYSYHAYTYNFYVCPRPLATVDERFVCQASCLQFLTRHNFDFNKFIRDGVSYLNEDQINQLQKDLEDGVLLGATERRSIQFEDEDALKEAKSKVTQWVESEPIQNTGNETNVGKKFSFALEGSGDPVVKYVLHQEIRNTFPKVWTFDDSQNQDSIIVEIVTSERRKNLVMNDTLKDQLVGKFKGFSRVIDALIESKKPLVGHNCFLDIMKIYHQFYKPLPYSYSVFKSDIHKCFPAVYDTKFLSYELRRRLEDAESDLCLPLVSSNLKSLFDSLNKNSTTELMYSPKICHAEGFEKYIEQDFCHEAGYDGYMTGYIFIKLAHISASLNYLSPANMKPLRFIEHLNCLKAWRNKLNIGRASIIHIDLQGQDPISKRPCSIYVANRSPLASTKGSAKSYSTRVAEKFARYGSVDVRTISANEALVAVANHRAARDILLAFAYDAEFTVSKYRALKHNKLLRWSIITGVTIFGTGAIGLGVYLVVKLKK